MVDVVDSGGVVDSGEVVVDVVDLAFLAAKKALSDDVLATDISLPFTVSVCASAAIP